MNQSFTNDFKVWDLADKCSSGSRIDISHPMNTLSPVCFMGRLLLLLFPMKICLNILEKWHPTTLSCYLWVIGIHKSISLWSFMRVYSIMRSVMMATFQVEFLIVIDYLKAESFRLSKHFRSLESHQMKKKLFRFDQFIILLKHSYRTKSRVHSLHSNYKLVSC